LLLDQFSNNPFILRIVVPVELAAVNIRTTLKVRFCEHRNHAKEHLLDALNGAPTFRGLFVHQGVVTGVVQNRDADVAVWIDVWVKQGRIKLHLERG